jgi:hypothetical protein
MMLRNAIRILCSQYRWFYLLVGLLIGWICGAFYTTMALGTRAFMRVTG